MAGMAELGFSNNRNNFGASRPPPYGATHMVSNADNHAQIDGHNRVLFQQEGVYGPSFKDRYPEGRDKLLALAEGPPKQHQSNRTPTGGDNQHSAAGQQKQCLSAASGRPRMGLKGKTPGSQGPPNATRKPLRPTPIYASEQSLPDRLSQALRGFGHPFKTAADHGGATATVAADDVVYYPSSTGGTGSSGGSGGRQPGEAGPRSRPSLSPNHPPSLSRSSEMIAKLGLGPGGVPISDQTPPTGRGAPPPIPPKYCHGINSLDQLRQLYKSMPDCSTLGRQDLNDYDRPPPPAYRYFGQTMEMANVSPPGPVLPQENHVNRLVLDEDYEAEDEGDFGSVEMDRKPTPRDVGGGPAGKSQTEFTVDEQEQFGHKRNSLSDDSTYANIDEYRMLKESGILVQHNPSHSASSCGLESSNESLGVDTRSRPPAPMEPPPPNGSPTDSGYRSVPRHLTDNQQQLYANGFEVKFNRIFISAGAPSTPPKPCVPPKKDRQHEHQENEAGIQNISAAASAPSPASSTRSKDAAKLGRNVESSERKKAANGSLDTINTNVSLPEEFSLERCPKLVELDRVPWNEKDVVTVLQRGRTKDLVHRIAIDVVPRLTYLLQRPLIRISREMGRLSQRFGKCTQNDVQAAVKVVVPGLLVDSCLKAGIQASSLYSMSGDIIKQSKSQRAYLRFCVGKFHRWLCDAQVCQCVHDRASVFLTAVCECLLEEMVLCCMPGGRAGSSTPLVGRRTPSMPEIGQRSPSVQSGDMLTSESLDLALANSSELWGMLQPYEHLISSRTANGLLCLPNSFASPPGCASSGKSPEIGNNKTKNKGTTTVKNLEQCLLATCVGSVHELAELVKRVCDQQQLARTNSFMSMSTPSNLGTSISAVGSWKHPQNWSDDALETLYYFMRCSQLEHSDNPSCTPPAVLLAHERPYLVLPPLVDWLRVAQAHCEHRQGAAVDADDVRQAARVLLPGLDCPPRLFEPEAPLRTSVELSPQLCTQRFKQDLGMQILATGRGELVPQAIGLLGPKKLNTYNEQGITPLMLATLRGHGNTVQVLLDSGADVNVSVPENSTQDQCPNLLPDLAGWTALNLAVCQRNVGLVRFLLERGCADVETEAMRMETPLQLAAMMGSHEITAMLLSCGADPYYSTIKSAENGCYGFKDRGLPAPVALAAAHGHRSLIQLMLKRGIRGRTEEVLSLQDFLAESNSPKGKKKESRWEDEHRSRGKEPDGKEWSKKELKVLQEAMYHAAESGHLDVTMDLRSLGIPWNTHIWTQTLSAAHDLKRKSLIQHLLTDFASGDSKLLEDISQEFIEDGLPLLFDIFRHAKHDVTSAQLADILSKLYGNDRIPGVESEFGDGADWLDGKSRIDPKYVNNEELSDVKFEIEGREFFAHRIVLVNASRKFKELLLKSDKDGGSRIIEIQDVAYDVFELMMDYLYRGRPSENFMDLSHQLQLLSAARQFAVHSLVRICATQIARCISLDNCLEIYRFAVIQECVPLQHYCEGYFLQNLPRLMHGDHPVVESFRKTLYSSGRPGKAIDLCQGLIGTLQNRLETKLKR